MDINKKEELFISDKDQFLSNMEEVKSSTSSTSSKVLRREHWAIFLAVVCHFIWALGVLVMKVASYRDKFSPNNYSMWRSLFMSLVTFISVKYYTTNKMNSFMEMKVKVWFLTRVLGIYLSFLFFLSSLLYLRAATTSCISSSNPLIVIFLSIFILKEKFYWRYLIGVIICFIGSAMILLNDRTENKSTVKQDFRKGAIYISLHVFVLSFSIFGQKICVNNGINSETMVFWTGTSNLIIAFLVSCIMNDFGLDYIVIFMAFLNAIIFYLAQKVNDMAFALMDASKFAPTFYIQTLFVFILCAIFFKEKFVFSDIIGSLMIVSFHFYNAYSPIKSERRKN